MFSNSSESPKPKRITIEQALAVILRQMEVGGNRERTISDYRLHVSHFKKSEELTYLHEITYESIHSWLEKMDVSAQTRLTRLKCFKAFLSPCFDNGWFKSKFWKNVKVKVDRRIKEGATELEIKILLLVLDLTDFVQLRDAAAVLLMYKTGMREGRLQI